MEYYFNELDPVKFQRLVNTILVTRFGEDACLTPLRGQDGGKDGETALGNPYFEYQISDAKSVPQGIYNPPHRGRYLFQVKHHRTVDKRLSEVRQTVLTDFKKELKSNVLSREGDERINYFFLVTNVPSSKNALEKLDDIRNSQLKNFPNLHADVWWQERIIAHLDQMPLVWNSFPEMFAGGIVPFLARVVDQTYEGLPRAIRLAVNHQYEQDSNVKFRQIELEKSLSKLFVDLYINIHDISKNVQRKLMHKDSIWHEQPYFNQRIPFGEVRYGSLSALNILLDDNSQTSIRKLILEGGPGQGKSTLTQMAVQIYREQLLRRNDIEPENRWLPLKKLRLPFRIELRRLAEWLSTNSENSIEEYLSVTIKQDSGGNEVSIDDIHTIVEKSPVLLIFDGLDEIGSNKLRDDVLKKIMECISRFEKGLQTDLRVVITTRPPALTGRREGLMDFERLTLAPMESDRIEEYVTRWLTVQIRENEERNRIRQSFERRQNEPHVEALARNPMQLSVLLQFIGLKGEAFPDRRAELYRDYFQIVIDRDVEKSPELRKNRDIIEALHSLLGYRIHALTEVNQADRTLDRRQLLDMVGNWLKSQRHNPDMAEQFFKLGEERFGLVVASKGEGEETRYGYEVQPIQEYFAASFISNQIPADSAHKVFEAIIHRSYWKEVALFLAGLRRPNEKADLVSRANMVDKDKKIGWYQDGRAIVLQLLHEGVFSEPRSVFSDALDFVLDLLDVKKIKVQREPPNLLRTLESLVSHNLPEPHQERIFKLVQDYGECEDWYALMRVYKVASQLLKPADYEKAICSYKGKHPRLVAQVRLGWPYKREADINKLAKNPSFWEGVPHSVWAEVWWKEALHRGIALDLPAPDGVHHGLIVQFAAGLMNNLFYFRRKRPLIQTMSKLAIWKMARYQQALQLLVASKSIDEDNISEMVKEEIASVREDNSNVDYEGIDENIQTVVTDMIQLTRDLLISSCDGDIEKSPVLGDYIEGVREHLKNTGIAGWVALRCATSLIQNVRRKRQPIEKVLLPLAKDMHPFYDETVFDKSMHLENDAQYLHFLIKRHRRSYAFPLYQASSFYPKYVRMERGSKPVALVDLFVKSIHRGSNLPFVWMKSISFPTEFIRLLVERCRDCLSDLLIFLGECSFVDIGPEALLRVQDTQRILKIARNTDDPNVLAGVATSLMNASFLRIAKSGLIQKILQAAPNVFLANEMFGVHKDWIGDSEQKSFGKEIKTLKQVARNVLNKPEKYTFKTVCLAANFIAEHEHVDFQPLLYEEEKIGI